MVKLDFLSDPVCPWCHIGKGLPDRPPGGKPEYPFTMERRPFQLNPDMPAAGAGRADIAARDAHSRSRGVTAVPTCVIANQYALSGAQPVDLWHQVIREITERTGG
jgi:predicted DsbA family dithiol-disulfide isomerase